MHTNKISPTITEMGNFMEEMKTIFLSGLPDVHLLNKSNVMFDGEVCREIY